MKKLRLHDSNKIHPKPLPLFKCCTFDAVDFQEKKPSTDQTGLLSPITRHSAPAANGNIKQMSSSQTMSVPEVVTFAERL